MFPVFVVDDNELVRLGIGSLLATSGRCELVGQTGSAIQAAQLILATRPEIVILDDRLPDGNGIELCRALQATTPRPRCIVLSEDEAGATRAAAFSAGAAAYIRKPMRRDVLLDALVRVALGQQLLSAPAPHDTARRRPAMLSPRELQVLALLGAGMTNRQIGYALHLSEKTVKNYVSGLLSKLGFERRTQAAVYAATHDGGTIGGAPETE